MPSPMEVEASRSEWRSAAEAYRRAVGFPREPAMREQLELALLDVYLAGHDTAYGLGLARELTQRPASRLVGRRYIAQWPEDARQYDVAAS